MSYRSGNLSGFLFAVILSARNGRRFHQIIRERELSIYKKGSVRGALSRMHKLGYIENSKYGWILTEKGYSKSANIGLFDYISSPFGKDVVSNTLIAFDIPEKNRKIRNWLRNQLKIFGYEMLQQSLWLGPGPLPKLFRDKVTELGIKKNVKIFSFVKKQK